MSPMRSVKSFPLIFRMTFSLAVLYRGSIVASKFAVNAMWQRRTTSLPRNAGTQTPSFIFPHTSSNHCHNLCPRKLSANRQSFVGSHMAVRSVQFSSVQGGIYTSRKAHWRSIPLTACVFRPYVASIVLVLVLFCLVLQWARTAISVDWCAEIRSALSAP